MNKIRYSKMNIVKLKFKNSNFDTLYRCLFSKNKNDNIVNLNFI